MSAGYSTFMIISALTTLLCGTLPSTNYPTFEKNTGLTGTGFENAGHKVM